MLSEQQSPALHQCGALLFTGYALFHQLQTMAQDRMVVKENRFLYIYTSNESPQDVFFDNVILDHITGPVLEETHYYPFGLTMSGISSKAPGKLENKNEKFQGQPLDDELELNWYGFKWRNHDPQIGRFIQVDPLSDKYVHNSTYAFSENKVTSHVELEGLEAYDAKKLNNPMLRRVLRENVQASLNEFNSNAGKSFSVTGSIGPGVGVKSTLGPVKTEVFLNGPQIEATVTAGGDVKGQAALVGAGVSAGNADFGKIKGGVSFGNVKIDENGQIATNGVESGLSAKLGPSKEVSQGTTSEKMQFDILSAYQIGLGMKFGVVGLEIKANVKAAGNAVVSFINTIVEYTKETARDNLGTNVGGNIGRPNDEDNN
jgi:RHS repeat-associated protein